MNNYTFYIYLGILFCMSLFIGSVKITRYFIFNLLIVLGMTAAQLWVSVELFEIHSYIPEILSVVLFFLFQIGDKDGVKFIMPTKKKSSAICLPVLSGITQKNIEFNYPYANFLVYGGAGSGKTKSIGKWLLEEYIRLGFAGFIYDFKDTDYSKTAWNLIKKYDYKPEFYYVSFDNLNYSSRFNPLKVVQDRTFLMQLMEDMLLSLQSKDAKQDEWFSGGLGILRGVAYRMWDEYNEYCTIPHILALIMMATQQQLTEFLSKSELAEMMSGAFLKAAGSEKTQASYLSTLCNQIATIAADENIAWVLSGDDFDFNLIDPEHPKLFAISNNFSKNTVYSPVIAMLMSISSRQFTMQNKVPFVYFLDEMTTVKVKNFETLPSVLREYKAAFVLLTQSGAKLENLYGKLDRSSVEANFGNMFLGRTKDVEALKYYPMFFGKEEKERRSKSTGRSGASSNTSVTISSQKEDVYQGKDFSELEPGEFIGSATVANVKNFKVKFKMFQMEEEVMETTGIVTPQEIRENYANILSTVKNILEKKV